MTWEGYEMTTGNYRGREYGIVFPKGCTGGEHEDAKRGMEPLPYVWRAEFFGAFPEVDLAMLEKGYAVVYYRISDQYGSPYAVGEMNLFQIFLQDKFGLLPQAVLFGFSRGGLYALHYAAKYPERVASLYLDAPVVDIYSWPGGCGLSEKAAVEWGECIECWQKSHDEYRVEVDSAIKTLLTWHIPLIMVAGGKDEVVPYSENGAILQASYENSGVPFKLIMKPDCGHHPHSLKDPEPVVQFLIQNRLFPTEGNAFRINDQTISGYPLVLMIHDRTHIGLVAEAEKIFSGKLPFGYVGTSPWPGTVTNQRTLGYGEPLNEKLYRLLFAQMEIGWIICSQSVGGREEEEVILKFLETRKELCPLACRIWLKKKDEILSESFLSELAQMGVNVVEYGDTEEFLKWMKDFSEKILKAKHKPSAWFDSYDREWAEWTNLSLGMRAVKEEKRILLVGDSISAGYGDMVQQKMPGFCVDRLNTSEGIHHPNFLRLLQIAMGQRTYRLVHINNGIHLHGQDVKQYGENLWGVFTWLHLISPQTKIVFATTTPLSRRLSGEVMEKIDRYHFSMGDRAPVAGGGTGEYWVTDEEASKVYREINEKAKEVCAVHNIPVNDLYKYCVSENLQKSDGVHFREEAYEKLAEKIADVLKQELSIFP